MSTQPRVWSDKPTCGATIEGPIVKDRGRSRPLWRDQCRRKVASPELRCWQHGGPRKPKAEAAGGGDRG